MKQLRKYGRGERIRTSDPLNPIEVDWATFQRFARFGFLLSCLLCTLQANADEFIFSGTKLVDYLIVRPQTSESRFPVAVCKVPLYDIPAGTSIVVNAWSNVTNDSLIDNVGHTCELHLCDPECVYGSEASRFDKLGGVAQGGGSNVTRDMHHDDTSRYGRITLRDYRAVVTVELQCRAYNKRAVGNKNRLTVDGCGIDVQEVQ